MTYVYDDRLHTMEKYWQEEVAYEKLAPEIGLMQIQLGLERRLPGQPELAWKEVKMPFSAVNT